MRRKKGEREERMVAGLVGLVEGKEKVEGWLYIGVRWGIRVRVWWDILV